jgi:ankyrin repeat protein
MPKILPPYQVETPEHVPGMVISVIPTIQRHVLWLEDYEYYDQLGRDPLQLRKIWGIPDAKERIEKVKEVLEEYPKQMHRRRLLLKAVERGEEDIVRCILETGLRVHPDLQKAKEDEEKEENRDPDDVDLPDKDDATVAPMHLAASYGHISILKMLIEYGVDVDIVDEFGRTPFLAAALSNETEAMKFLLDQGADVTARVTGNELAKEYTGKLAACNALEAIACRGDVEMVKMLLEKPGVEITPLAIWSAAVGGNTYEVLRLLLERGGCLLAGQDGLVVNDDNEELRQALLDAIPLGVQENNLKSLKLLLGFKYPELLRGKTSPDQIPEELHKPFTYGAYTAVANDEPDKFEFIYSLGVTEHDTMSLDDLPEGQTINIQHLLENAAEHGSINCARLLIEKYGADPNKYRESSWVTPLYLAAGNDKPDMVRFLLENHDMDLHIPNGLHANGPTALWVAITHKSFKSIELLLQHGGPLDAIDKDILSISGPLDAVLTTSFTGEVRFETETTAKKYIDDARDDYSIPNSLYVRIALDIRDRDWIARLQTCERDAERRIGGREKAEEFPERPVFKERYDKLMEDDDLIPRFQPIMK